MNWADYVIIGIVGLSALISVIRGFVREALSLGGWVAAFWVGITFSEGVAGLLADQISTPSARDAVAFLALFAGTLLLSALVLYLVGLLVEKTGLSGTDRMLGIVFGVGRGCVIGVLLVLLAGFTALPADPWWQESVLLPHFERAATELRAWLPPEIAEQIEFLPALPPEAVSG